MKRTGGRSRCWSGRACESLSANASPGAAQARVCLCPLLRLRGGGSAVLEDVAGNEAGFAGGTGGQQLAFQLQGFRRQRRDTAIEDEIDEVESQLDLTAGLQRTRPTQ